MRTAVVTGVGAVSPFGVGVEALWDGLRAGACAIRPLTLIETDGFRCGIGAEVPGAIEGSRRRSRADRLALAAAREALDDAGLSRADRAETGIIVGAVGGGMLEAEPWYWAATRGQRAPSAVLRAVMPSAHAETVGHVLGLGGPRETVVAACSSGAASVALAQDLVRDGVADVVLAGGVDALTRVCFMGFNALRLLDPVPCRPFDRERRGMSIGEGAAFLVVEEAGRARARGAQAYAEVAGHGMTSDAFHVTSPEPEGEGMIRAMRLALERAGVPPDAVGYCNAHGTGTLQNDRVEARALRAVFGDGGLLVSATKSMIGHTMAAAGSLEAVATILALTHGVIPPTAHLTTPDPELVFDGVPGVARPAAMEWAISNSFGFGGQNVTLVFHHPC